MRVVDVPVRPVYGPAWRSGLRPLRVVLPIAWLLLRGAWRRIRARWAGAPSRRRARRGRRDRRGRGAVMNIGVVTTSFPRHAGDYAGSFVGDRVRRCSPTATRSR